MGFRWKVFWEGRVELDEEEFVVLVVGGENLEGFVLGSIGEGLKLGLNVLKWELEWVDRLFDLEGVCISVAL